ncbi:hypothetical protein [Aequorivita capsosiphonis]|uniref:hypothetical protein n=1 Tax=Aequorivita capsosiphonis TaxID=487317 RepID=UPI0004093522|nr:hypothetical protein [Aequorivita capsosiphonis]
MNISEQIPQILKNVGVTQIWCVIGNTLNIFTNALRDNGDINWNAILHIENEVFAEIIEGIIL